MVPIFPAWKPAVEFRVGVRRLGVLLLLLSTPGTLLAISGHLPGALWWLDLAVHFLPYSAAAQVIALGIFLAIRYWKRFVLTMGVLMGSLWSLSPLMPALHAPSRARPLRILSHNLFAWNGRKEETVRFILESNADVVGLTEVEFGWSAALAPLRSVYPFRRIELQDGCFGMALFSKVPVEELTSTSEDGPLRISATLIRPWSERGPQRVALHVMHPPPPMGSGPYQLRRRILQRPGSLRDRTPDVIVLGDFNTGPWSADYRAAFPRQEWRNVREGFGLMPTWQSTMPWPLGLSIDHIVMTRSIRAVEAWTDEGIGSDHRPIVASLVPTDDVHYPHKINESEGEMPVG